MTYLEAWIHSPYARALGWSLLHFLWEGLAIGLVTAALLFLFRRESARLRYTVACAALFAMPVAVAVTVALTATPTLTPRMAPRIDVSTAGSLATGFPAPEPSRSLSSRLMPWVAPLWVAGVLIFYLRSLGSWLIALRVRRTGVCAASAEWQSRLRILRARVRIAKPVALLESCLVEVPVVIGFLRPVILMPVSLIAGLSANQLESILIHELAHIRRWDYLVNLLQNVVEGLLFYHPAVWWVSNQIRAERENCCDDVVVSLQGNAREYAAALATLEQNRWPSREPALAASGGSLMKRIRRLLQEPQRPRTSAAPSFVLGLLVVTAGVAAAGWQIKPARESISPDGNVTVQQARSAALPNYASSTESATAIRPLKLIARAETPPDQAAQNSAASEKLRMQAQKLYAQAQIAQGSTEPADPEKVREASQKLIAVMRDMAHKKWMNEDVAYIISDEERSAFKRLPATEEQEHFIEQFWLRRDPTPGTPQNEMKDEHYRRIASTNARFSDGKVDGWKTDRGRIYIIYGPPDEIDSHPSGGAYQPSIGAPFTTVPFEKWTYRYIQDVGNNVTIEFVDKDRTGEFRQTIDPSSKDALLFLPPSPSSMTNGSNRSTNLKVGTTVQILGTPTADGKAVMISVPLNMFGTHKVELIGTIRSPADVPAERTGTPGSVTTTTISRSEPQQVTFHRIAETPTSVDTRIISLKPGPYHIRIIVRDIETGALASDDLDLEVK